MEYPHGQVRIAVVPQTADERFREFCNKYWQIRLTKGGNYKFEFDVSKLEAQFKCKYLPEQCHAYAEGPCFTCGAETRYELRNRTEFIQRLFYRGIQCQACIEKHAAQQREVAQMRDELLRNVHAKANEFIAGHPNEHRQSDDFPQDVQSSHSGNAATLAIQLGESKQVVRFDNVTGYDFHINETRDVGVAPNATVQLSGEVRFGELVKPDERDSYCYLIRVTGDGTYRIDRVHAQTIGKSAALIADEFVCRGQSIRDELADDFIRAIREDFIDLPLSEWDLDNTETENVEDR